MSKGYAFGFLIVLLVLILGLYVAFTGFMSSRAALRAEPAPPTSTKAAQQPPSQVEPSPSATETELSIPTPSPGETMTPTVAIPTEPPASAPTEAPPTEPPEPVEPPSAQPTDTPAAAQPPTPAPAPAYQFRLGGPPYPDSEHPNCCYILGTVRDAAGNGLEGVLVQAYNEWNTLSPAATKGGSEAGQYNIPLGHDAVTWYVVVVDAAGNHISTQTPISFDPSVANAHRVDWQRTY